MIWKDFGCAQFEEIGQHSQFMTEVGVACTDSGMRCVELKQNSDVEIVSIFTMLGSSHTDFAGSVSRMSCVEMLLVVF